MNKKWKKIIGFTVAATGVAFVGASLIARKKKADSVYSNAPEQKNPLEGKKVVFVSDDNDMENADGVKGHLEAIGDSDYKLSLYDHVKRGLDVVLSFGGLVVLSPVFAGIAIAIKIDDPGPVLFTQKRLGQNKQYFKLHKFRSMKMSTPHNVPTHMLDNPEQYITRVGKFLRAHSLDELPQIWDIFIGNMSVIGPRPGLWNQDLLTAERDKYGVNEVKPGLTGWAQINGRDELEIPDKAKLDGEYVEKRGLLMDCKCFLGSLHVFGEDKSVVEGGTGNIKGLPVIAVCHEDTDFTEHKKILIAGAGSYIGKSFKSYLSQFENYIVDSFDTISDEWKHMDFSSYDVVYDVAGIAHIKETDGNRHLYYDVNRDLAAAIAEKAKAEGVSQFIYLSSMSVYGMSEGRIDSTTHVAPNSAYGKSKLEAEQLLWKLNDENFIVSILRPPMVYGNGCKGNYQTLRKFALKVGFFPEYDNERSMLYIDNLSSAVRGIIHNNEPGLYFPQNLGYVKTYDMVKQVVKWNGGSFKSTTLINIPVKLGTHFVGVFKKVFGTLTYDEAMNVPVKWIDVKDNEKCVRLTESAGSTIKIDTTGKKVLVLMSTYNGEKYIEQQIESILNQQTKASISLRIRDDGSTDDTCKIIKTLQNKYPSKIELICGENGGYNFSFFELINGAEGYDYYSLSDQDDVWLPEKIEVAVSTIMKQEVITVDMPILYASTSYLVHDDLVPYGTTRIKRRDFSFYNTIIQNICPGHTQVFNGYLLVMLKNNIDTSRIYVYDSWITNIANLYGKILFDNKAHTYYRQYEGNQLGSGAGKFGQLIASLKRRDSGDGHKYRRQIEYFTEMNRDKLCETNYYPEISKFINSKSFSGKMKYLAKSELYRQNSIETLAFYFAVLTNNY